MEYCINDIVTIEIKIPLHMKGIYTEKFLYLKNNFFSKETFYVEGRGQETWWKMRSNKDTKPIGNR